MTPCTGPARLLYPWNFPGRNIGMGCHFFLQGLFLTQGSSLCLLRLLHRKADLLPPLRHLEEDRHREVNSQLSVLSPSYFLLLLHTGQTQHEVRGQKSQHPGQKGEWTVESRTIHHSDLHSSLLKFKTQHWILDIATYIYQCKWKGCSFKRYFIGSILLALVERSVNGEHFSSGLGYSVAENITKIRKDQRKKKIRK